MATKPSACVGCHNYGSGQGFLQQSNSNEANEQVRLYAIGPRPGKTDVDCQRLGVGFDARYTQESLRPLTGLQASEFRYTTLIQCCSTDVRKGFSTESISGQAVSQCQEIRPLFNRGLYPALQLVVCMGKDTFNAITHGQLSFSDWRGFLLPIRYTAETFGDVRVYVTHYPNEFHTEPAAEPLTEWDWIKIRSILDGTYPSKLPNNLIGTAENLDEVVAWFNDSRNAQWITCDTEFIPNSRYLTILGLLARHADGRLSGLQFDWRKVDGGIKQEVAYRYRELIKHVPVVFHNCRADIPMLAHNLGANWTDYKQYHDTMLAHAVLWCELPHSLEFIASVWGRYDKLKHLKSQDELLYNFGDVLETDAIWDTIVHSSFKHDPLAEQIYKTQHLKLCPILDATVERGLRVNKPRVNEARLEYETKVKQAELLAMATAGWPININSSQQLAWYLYVIRGLPVQMNKKSKSITIDDAAVATLRMALGPSFDPEEELTYDIALNRISKGADPILEARVLYAGAQTRLIKYIYPLYHSVATSTSDKARDEAILAIREGRDSGILLDRIHPDMLIHTQKTGRWSTVDPPIAQLPSDLRNLVCPDPEEVWVHWDWSSIEPRVLEGLCGSRILKRSFDEGIDLHTWTVCKLFNYEFPPDLVDPHKGPASEAWRLKYGWKGSDDPRRVFAKTGRYEMYYGGTGTNAANAAALFGLDPRVLKRALDSLLSADPEYYVWRLHLEESLKRTRMVRTFMGRPRRFLKGGDKMIREGLDQPMQGAVSDIANTTVIQLHELGIPSLQLAWTMHDAQYWHCAQSIATPKVLEAISHVATRSHIINGRSIPFPIKMDIIDDKDNHYTLAEYLSRKSVHESLVATA